MDPSDSRGRLRTSNYFAQGPTDGSPNGTGELGFLLDPPAAGGGDKDADN